jgi:hypothetical protein
MKNHKRNNTILIWLLFAILLTYGCYTITTNPNQSFQSSIDESIVFGHLEILSNGQIVPIKSVMLSINPQSERSRFSVKYFNKFGSDGYFITTLPVDKYAIIGISRPNLREKICEGHGICEFIYLNQRKYVTIDFEVVPGRATYIGTIKFIVSTDYRYFYEYQKPMTAGQHVLEAFEYGILGAALRSNPNPIEKIYATSSECFIKNLSCKKEPVIVSEDWNIKSDFEKARKTFTSLYPNHSEPIENLAEICSGKKCLPKPSIYK